MTLWEKPWHNSKSKEQHKKVKLQIMKLIEKIFFTCYWLNPIK